MNTDSNSNLGTPRYIKKSKFSSQTMAKVKAQQFELDKTEIGAGKILKR